MPPSAFASQNIPVPDVMTRLGSVFTENVGQNPNQEILFYALSGRAAFTRDSVIFHSRLVRAESPAAREANWQEPDNQSGVSRENAFEITFVGANSVVPEGNGEPTWRSNYIMGNNPAQWHTGVANYGRIIYRNLWNGIDLAYYTENSSLKYDFIIHPHADHEQIKMKVNGHDFLGIMDDGSLHIGTGLGPGSGIIDSGLDVFYADDRDAKIPASFVLDGQGNYAFDIGQRDKSRTMIIDPIISSNYLGGSGLDLGVDIAVGTDGSSYVTGYTDSVNFPTTLGVFETDYTSDTYDGFVTKISPAGDEIVYSTYFGDIGSEYPGAIAVDSSGHAYITGHTASIGFPTTVGALDRTYNGDSFDAFVTKFSPSGDSLVYSTFLGASRVEKGYDIVVDTAGYAYVAGETWSFDFPTTLGAMTRIFNGGATGGGDAFVTKLAPAGNSLVFSTFLGGNDCEAANGIAIDDSGYVYVTGYTRSTTFPTAGNSFDRSFNGAMDTFITKLTRSGGSLSYSTFIGGSSGERGHKIAVDKWGDAYVTGYTSSNDFPVTDGAFDTTFNGWIDSFVVRVNKFGDSLIYSTYIGGLGGDIANGIALDSFGCAYVSGYTDSEDFPTTVSAFDRTYNGNVDAFVTKINPSGTSLSHSTYLGGSGFDCANSIAITGSGFTFITGETESLNFPVVSFLDRTYNGAKDAFVTMMDIYEPSAYAGPDQFIDEGQNATFSGRGSTDNHGIVNYTWTFHDGIANRTLFNTTPSHNFIIPGIYEIVLNVSDASGNWDTDIMTVTVLDITLPAAIAGQDQTVDEGSTVEFNGAASSDNVGIVNFTWSFNYGFQAMVLNGPSVNFTFIIPGIYEVVLAIFDAAGNHATDSLVVTVLDITPPMANAGPNRAIPKNTHLTFNGTASTDNVGVVDYAWTFNDGVANVRLSGAMPTHLFTLEGIYPVTLNVTDAVGHWHIDTMTVTVLEIIAPVASAGSDISANENVPVKFDGSASTDNVGVARWSWSFNDGANDVALPGVSPTWTFTVPGVYEVTLTVYDAAGNSDSDTMSVTILDATAPLAIAGPNQVLAEGAEAIFNGSRSRDSSGRLEHTWSFTYNGTLVTLTGESQSFRFWTPGTYTITLSVRDAAGNYANDTLTVTVLPSGTNESIGADNWWVAIIVIAIIVSLAIIFYRPRERKVKP